MPSFAATSPVDVFWIIPLTIAVRTEALSAGSVLHYTDVVSGTGQLAVINDPLDFFLIKTYIVST